MKKLLLLIALLFSLTSFAQYPHEEVECSYVKSKGIIYLSISTESSKKYYKSGSSVESIDELCSVKLIEISKEVWKDAKKSTVLKYISSKNKSLPCILENAKNCVSVAGNNVTQSNTLSYTDEFSILAKPLPDVNLSTSAGLLADTESEMLYVMDAQDKSLVGCHIVCKVIESRKSNIGGSEGRLSIRPLYIISKDGKRVRLEPEDIQRRGLNRTNAKFWTSFLIIPIFLPGTGASISNSEIFQLTLK